jgi:tetratricopeptide (TPR) repeat protein
MKYSILFACVLLFIGINSIGQSKIQQAKILFEQQQNEQVKKILVPITNKDVDFAAAQYYLGRVAYEEKKFDDAVDFFEETIDASAKVADYHFWLGNAYRDKAMESNMLSQAMLAPKMKKAWENAAALDAKNIDARVSLVEFYIGAPSFMGGSIDKAKEMANQISKLNSIEGSRQMGNIANAEKQYEKAITFFEIAIKENPKDYPSLYQLGKACALSGQKLDFGEECLKKYLGYTPKPSEVDHAAANMRLAQIKEKQGNKAEAKKLYELALKSDSSLKEAKQGLERVSK